jgi:hypothetical protein
MPPKPTADTLESMAWEPTADTLESMAWEPVPGFDDLRVPLTPYCHYIDTVLTLY